MAFTAFSGLTGTVANLNAYLTQLFELREFITTPGYTSVSGRMQLSSAGAWTMNRDYGKANGWGLKIEAGDGSGTISDNVALLLNDGSSGGNGGNAIVFRQTNLAAPRRYAAIWGVTATSGSGGDLVLGAINSDNDTTGPSGRLRVNGAGGHVTPEADNTQTIGSAAKRWSTVYAGTGTINTSDAREKTALAALSQAELEAAQQLAREVGSFQFLSVVAEKGDAARKHIGLTVQRAMEILRAHGLDPLRYAFICHDAWREEKVEHPATRAQHKTLVDGDGRPVMIETAPRWTETRPAGDRYGFRSDELLLFIARGMEARQHELEARLAALEAAA